MGAPRLASDKVLEPLKGRDPTIATICSHSSLQIFHGARLEGFRTLGIARGRPPRFYDAFPLAKPDLFLALPKVAEIGEHAERLRKEGAVLVPTGSFVEYVGPERFSKLPVPVFGNRKVMEWESDREKERLWLEGAGVRMPRKFTDPSEIDGPVIVKYYGAKGGRGFILAKNRRELESHKIDEPHVIQEYVIGTRYYIHFFYSPLNDRGYRVGDGSLELLGMDRRDEANIDELYKLGSQEELLRAGIHPTFVVTGNVPVVIRESLLPEVFEIGEKIVERSIDLFGGMVGPFCVEGIMTEKLEFYVFEISTRIVAGTNVYINGSPYSDMVAPGLSTGRRIAIELKRAISEGRLAEVLS
ncbi:MAG: formate--phosphoribosylaminoimidazolecarboxamide ligase [Euryarchaeota archaeon]|nr:formate--phosphoribosylaminoimidazolecarboxamide ligase [Euryarchaeota archaeon]MDE1836129.1 formate--phosphoribosylaminoimidazolecarboxamide ligase [Euryarchaeota archaeon]MDE1879419.1 formate--phosphoribosylaminoimidazolecarboxamide ligase [Euryarchaeota archaeon]MDE2044107.1 formate--phosphoribosylaminoimidazolecarboxamide ligase [Thermoplasmata archaeon]